MNKKITKMIILFSLLLLLISITSAATVNNNTDNPKITSTTNTNKIIKENTNTTTQNNQIQKSSDKNIEKNTTPKDTNNKKNLNTNTTSTDKTKNNNTIKKSINSQETNKKDLISSLLFNNLGKSITIILPANANDNITINMDGFTYSFKQPASFSNITGTQIPTGIYQYALYYTGDGTHQPFSKSGTINITNKNDSITPQRVHNITKDLETNIIDEGNGIITLESDGKKTSLNIGQTVVNILTSNMPSGKYQFVLNYTGNNKYPAFHIKGTLTINIKHRTIITLKQVWGVIGEKITLNATITDSYGRPVNGGNLVFKLNGKTLRTDGRFDSNAPARKFPVKNGQITYTITADLYLRNTKNLTASYSGTKKYTEEKSPTVIAQIQKRSAMVTVTSTPSKAKQYETLTFKITAKDTTKNAKNNTAISQNTKIMLKINGNTLKDNKGNIIYLKMDKNNQATYKYTIPAGMAGITSNKAVRNYIVTAVFVGDNYYPGTKNTTTFQVERSPTTIIIHEATVSDNVTITPGKVTSKTLLNINATLKDYKGNNLFGTNKVTIKINGKNYVDPNTNQAKYWNVKNGVVILKDVQVDYKTTVKRVMVVTGERQAYMEGRAETTDIKYIQILF